MFALLVLALFVAVSVGGLFLFTLRAARQAEKAVPPLGRFVDVPGARLHIVDKGRGDSVLLVHGLGGQLQNFNYGVVDRLAKKYRVVAVDRPGSGYSTRAPGASATLSAQADALAALIDALKLDRPVVVGHSLGGAIALTLAQRHPDKVAGLALLAPATHVVDVPPVFKGLVIPSPWLRALVAWTMATPMGVLKGDEILRQVFAPSSRRPISRPAGAGCSRSGQAISSPPARTWSRFPRTCPRWSGNTRPCGCRCPSFMAAATQSSIRMSTGRASSPSCPARGSR